MQLLISHKSALEFWRTAGNATTWTKANRRSATSRAKVVINPKANKKPNLNVQLPPALTHKPLDLLVNKSTRLYQSRVNCHVWESPLPPNSFIALNEQLLLSSPEFCFVQLASKVPLIELIMIGFEICGVYSLPSSLKTMSTRKNPLTTAIKLRSCVEATPKTHGHRKAREALNHIVENSASPMETVLAMHLCLPYRMGGYGFEKPQMNSRIEIGVRSFKAAGKACYVADLYWPKSKLIVEYDSDQFHASQSAIAHDSARRNALIHAGKTVISVTKAQVADPRELAKVAHAISKALGKRLRFVEPGFSVKQKELRDQISKVLIA